MVLKGTVQDIPFVVNDDLSVDCQTDKIREVLEELIAEGFSPADGYIPQALRHRVLQEYGPLAAVTDIAPMPDEPPDGPDTHF